MSHLLPALTLGLVSSVLAYLGFIFSGFPGFTQVAIFSAVGLITAYWMVVGLYPWLLQRPPRQQLPVALVQVVSRYRIWLAANIYQWVRWPSIVLVTLFVATGLWQISPLDDVRAMQIPDSELRAREQRFHVVMGQQTALQYLLVSGDSQEQLLRSMELLQPDLKQLVADGSIARYQMLSDWLPSQYRQAENRSLWQAAFIESGTLTQLLDTLGVVPEIAEKLKQQYQGSDKKLTFNETAFLLQQLPDAPLFFEEHGRWYGVVLLSGLVASHPFAELAAAHPDVEWVDIVGQTNYLLKEYRQGTLGLLVMAYLVIGALFSVRYQFRGALAILLPPLLATLLTLAFAGWLGLSVSVFNMMALLLVLGIGIDAALFMRESGGKHYYTLLAIGLSTATTLLSFGLLSLSATAAIQSFGVTILFGITLCFLLSPLAALSLQADIDEMSVKE